MERPELYATLSKDGNRVLCAITSYCGGVLGDVEMQSPKDEYSPTLKLPPGWYEKEGIYQITNYSRKQIEHYFAPAFRRHPNPRWRNPMMEVGSYPQLPCRARCPRCNRPQIIDPERLGLAPGPRQATQGAYLDDVEFPRWSEPIGDKGDLQVFIPGPDSPTVEIPDDINDWIING